ncbi:tetratricopeptide repeat protein [Wenxinia saemankumensis]|uniref:Tetratricopeptide repeat-containing protein n=1 Tax=Wenxinia saemankumensis TaxID=1447782 RepID=A0A1M6EA47_9RHOB|nr:tetratricopeptide repeat protein [Wenxinia saemankumensis]SHI82293.1 Tetratricopeptide repeat-containing protein [Wenxinia saemankumensis]
MTRTLPLAALLAATSTLATTALPVAAQEVDVGAYLSGRTAAIAQDYAVGAERFGRALDADPENPVLLQYTLSQLIGAGRTEEAAALSARLEALGGSSVVTSVVLQAQAFAEGDWEVVLARLEDGDEISPVIDGLARGWALVGAGRAEEGIAAFDDLTEESGLAPFGRLHKALALALVGDDAAAVELLETAPEDGLTATRAALITRAQALGRLGRGDEGAELIAGTYGASLDPELERLRATLAAGETPPFDVIGGAAEGMALAYYGVAAVLASDASDEVALTYARLAERLDPGNGEVLLLTGGLLDRIGRHDLAVETLGRIDPEDAAFLPGEMARADALFAGGEEDRAVAAMEALARATPDSDVVQVALGDLLRRTDDPAAAEIAYTRGIEGQEGDPDLWRRHYLRGIVRYQTDDWPGAEADFRASLELRPDNPGVLNYLGYSLLEEGGDLDEAVDLIERAVALQPENGAIVDSLGWAQFRAGDYAEATLTLERAAMLEPVDPVVNDHLGDAYWAVGRLREARFQWQRALSFDPGEEEAARIRAKLEDGLDAVLAEEGATPLDVAGTP